MNLTSNYICMRYGILYLIIIYYIFCIINYIYYNVGYKNLKINRYEKCIDIDIKKVLCKTYWSK